MKSLKEEKLYIKVVEEVKKEIMDGKLKPGDKLPPEREMAEMLEVSRASVREAMRALEVGGLVESKHGSGNFIRTDFSESLLEPLSLIFLLNDYSKNEIREMRSALAIQAALIASEKITTEEIDKLDKIIDIMRDSEDEELNRELDNEFHRTIILATDNVFINIIFSSISSLFKKSIKETRRGILLCAENKEKLNDIHKEIVEAFKEKNRSRLYDAMAKHSDIVCNVIGAEGYPL
ncbi:FadR/GntR family transcriptional regulator [Clostridium massiliamazoniense]|uniref:FadR/GntR family transcriptional regulator n=1 Tax=Clostridium massiliamazoniense TaxID=1347366 RepID=UPI001A9A580A|nr:GntR family transcriptional regulator [Clostridium massiliamazoniense]